ncbi:MAG: hypothetical protein Q9226_001942 [Calogaya cf. arnoldii]
MIPPLPLPVMVSPLLPIPQKRINNDPGVLLQVAEILEQHNILHYEIETGTLTRPAYSTKSTYNSWGPYIYLFKRVTSMRILVDVQDDVSTETWPASIETIRNCLQTRGFPTMQVEILDPKRCLKPFRFNILRDHRPLCLKHWKSIERLLSHTVKAYVPGWTIVAPTSRNRDADSYIICVDVPNQSKADYGHLLEVLLSIASDAGETVRVAVEFQSRYLLGYGLAREC